MVVDAPAMALKATTRGLPYAISEKTNMQRQRIAISNPARPSRRVIASFIAIFRRAKGLARPHPFGRAVSFDEYVAKAKRRVGSVTSMRRRLGLRRIWQQYIPNVDD